MSGLLDALSVEVPHKLALEAHAHLAQVGRQGLEGMVLWAGVVEDKIARVRHTVVPGQTALQLPDGVCVVVAADELHRLNVWLYREGLTLVAQLHSHPTEAYHSETDNLFPIATSVGSLSLVVPDFASQTFALARCAVYRLLPERGWVRLSTSEAEKLIRFIE